jgi:HAD superfamily hydrolase (TIGR01549 family)
MKEIKAILFDLGNTLSRSASLSQSLVDIIGSPIAEKLNLSAHQLRRIGLAVEQEIGRLYKVERLDQPDWRDVWASGIKRGGFDISDAKVEVVCRAHLAQFVKNCKVAPYSIPLLESLQSAKIPLGLVSNVTGPSEIFDNDLAEKGLKPYFDAVVWSSRVGVRKPNPAIYQIALDELKLKPAKEILMIGDRETADILGGKRLGFTTIKIETAGNGSSSVADYVVKGSELQSLLETQFTRSPAS